MVTACMPFLSFLLPPALETHRRLGANQGKGCHLTDLKNIKIIKYSCLPGVREAKIKKEHA
jgi:hypothetical protein